MSTTQLQPRHPHGSMTAALGMLLIWATAAGAQTAATGAGEPSRPIAASTGRAASTAPAATQSTLLPHIHVDRARKVIDLDASVTMREGKWLELLACTPQTRQHESILTTEAKPSHIHLGLILIGLQPGQPFKGERVGDEVRIRMPSGPAVAISIVVRRDGKEIETPANEWIMDHNTGKVMPNGNWLFTGSEMVEFDGQATYRADPNGTVISLVNFGDDLLSRPTDRTNENDQAMWGPNTDRIPPLGTPVIIRLRPGKVAPATRPG